jgi:Putative DNA-binding domain
MTFPPSQTDFAAALIDRALPVPGGVTSWTQPLPAKRFGVYRNNVSGALVEALAVRYPVVQRLVGGEFFRAMARDYALHNLPRSPVLIYYGADFPDFIASFEPAGSLPYLADVARLDSAHWESYHAEDATAVPQGAFASLDPAKLPNVAFEFLPSVRILSSPHPIVAIWRTNTEDAEVQAIDTAIAEDALVARPEMAVEVRTLPAGAAIFLSALRDGKPLGEAAGAALNAAADFNLSQNLAGLIAARITSRIIP